MVARKRKTLHIENISESTGFTDVQLRFCRFSVKTFDGRLYVLKLPLRVHVLMEPYPSNLALSSYQFKASNRLRGDDIYLHQERFAYHREIYRPLQIRSR